MNVPQREKNGESAFGRQAQARLRAAAGRPRWASLAGSILAGVVVGAWLWGGGSRNSLSDGVLKHLEDEAAALGAAGPAPAGELSRVLEQGGVRLRPDAGTVTYARSCRFRGQTVPHLVFRTEAGPVTLLVLRHEPADAAAEFKDGGFSGRILPSGPGSLAVAAPPGADLDPIAIRMQGAVEWID